MPAGELANRIGPWVGRIEPLDDESCVLTTGADRIEDFAAWLGFLGADSEVSDPPELVAQLRALAARYSGSTPG